VRDGAGVNTMTESRHITVAPESERSALASDMVVIGELGFVSGIRAVDLANDRMPIPERVEAQIQKIFANLDQILQAAGIEHRQLAFVRIYLVDFERLIERVNKAYLKCLGEGPLPARTIVGVSNITRGALLEMDFVVRIGA
jgi:2-iminobutanoate/2-iminopropanoate deaminase